MINDLICQISHHFGSAGDDKKCEKSTFGVSLLSLNRARQVMHVIGNTQKARLLLSMLETLTIKSELCNESRGVFVLFLRRNNLLFFSGVQGDKKFGRYIGV
jgi:hypothetical protein